MSGQSGWRSRSRSRRFVRNKETLELKDVVDDAVGAAGAFDVALLVAGARIALERATDVLVCCSDIAASSMNYTGRFFE